MESIWKKDVEPDKRKPLQGDLNVENVVIGAGIAGILIAYFLRKKGREVVIVEAKKIGSGQTGNTTAKITSQHDIFYDKFIKKVGKVRAKNYAKANQEAIERYEQIISEEKILCNFQRRPAYLYTLRKDGREKLKAEAKAATTLGIKASFIEGDKINELPFDVEATVCFHNQAQFHPMKFISHLADRLEIYEDTKVLSVNKHIVSTNRGTITADNIIFATHYPITNIPGLYFLRQHQERSYALALGNQKELKGMYYSMDENGLSLRSLGDTLLLGSGAHRTGKKDACKKQGFTYLRALSEQYYKDAKEVALWAAQDCMPHDEIPFIGKYSILRSYWYVATGFKKWGMTSAMVAAMIISDQICGINNAYEKTFAPWRFLIRASAKNLAKDISESVLGLSKGLFTRKRHRCPHMGCKLEWNVEENTLDCPCHGSRFSIKGELKDNPAQIDIK